MAANLQLVPPPAPDPRAERHDTLVGDVATRVQAIGALIAATHPLHRADQSKSLEVLRRQLDLEMTRLEFAAEQAWELAQ